MKVLEAKQLVTDLIARDLPSVLGTLFDPASPDGDPGTFMLNLKPARAIHHFSGWHPLINLGLLCFIRG